MIGNIRNSFIGMLDKSNWMDGDTKNLAKDKVNISKYVICKKNIYIIGSSYRSTNWLSGLFS